MRETAATVTEVPAVADTFLVGRARELEMVTIALESLGEGRGSTLLLSGEPGIGKSTLARCFAETARGMQFPVYWGFAWEAGGAPAYWPWTQLMRALVSEQDIPPALTRALSQILPEYAEDETDAPQLQPEQARFQLLELSLIHI